MGEHTCACGHHARWHTARTGSCNDWIGPRADCTCRAFTPAAEPEETP